MGKFNFIPCEIEGLYVIEPTCFNDSRGYFMETYNYQDFKEAGLTQASLARRLDVWDKTVSAWVTGNQTPGYAKAYLELYIMCKNVLKEIDLKSIG